LTGVTDWTGEAEDASTTDDVVLLTAVSAESTSSFRLSVCINSQDVSIPADIGVYSDGSTASVYTNDATGDLSFDASSIVTLGDFFDIWRTDAGTAGNNSNASLSSTELLGYTGNSTDSVKMFVNGQVSTEFGSHVLEAGDEIVLVYGSAPVVSLNTNLGPIVVELYLAETPGTVDNFLNYVNDGDYDQSIFHRSVTDFVIQGGGFTTTSPQFTDTSQFTAIPTDAAIANEPGISNTRGTIAMAKVSSSPDSATSQFFVNLSDDNSFLDSESNNAFTVFGHVLDMTTVDKIAALSINTDNESPYGELPMSDSNELAVVESVAGTGTLTGSAFQDDNADGAWDSTEAGLAGVTIYLDSNANGEFDFGETSTVTDSDGHFLFQVEPGTCHVRSLLSGSAYATSPSPSGEYTPTVEIGRGVDSLDFGEAETADPVSSTATGTTVTGLSGYVFHDADDDGQMDESEIGLPGIQITLAGTTAADAAVSRTAISDTSGYYEFTEMTAGTYSVSETQPQAFVDGTDTSGSSAATVTDDHISNLVLEDSQQITGNNFGERGLRASAVSFRWFLSSTRQNTSLLRETVALAEELAGNVTLALSIREAVAQEGDADRLASVMAYDDTYTVAEGGVLTVSAEGGVLADDSEANGGSLTAALTSLPKNGTIVFNANGAFSYTPEAGFFGTDSFAYSAQNSSGTTSSATVTVNVTSDNQAPVSEDESYAVDEDNVLTVNAAAGVLANDTDAEGTALVAEMASEPSHGTVVLSSDGSFVYTPTANYAGTDSFTYHATDGESSSTASVVEITISSSSDSPAAIADAYSVFKNHTLEVVASIGVLANDSDADGDALTAEVVTPATHGTTTLNSDGAFTYTPEADFQGSDEFVHQVVDAAGTVSQATVSIDVTQVFDVQMRLEATTANGSPVSSIEAGSSFVLNVYVEDLRDSAEGVFSAYLDISFDSSLVAVNGSITYGSAFSNGNSGDVSVAGIVNEAGGFSGSLTGSGGSESLLMSIPLRAVSSGTANLVADSADQSPAHDVGVFGSDDAVAASLIHFLGTSVEILPSGAEGESVVKSHQAGVDQAFADSADPWWL
jgi:VCBS repeat-containing protein